MGDLVRRRIGGELGPAAQRAAEQTAAHAGTPTRVWFDTLGRTFLAVAHNRVLGGDARLTDQYCRTHSALDIQGNEHEVRDALGRAVMRYGYAMLGGQVTHAGMDSRRRPALPDVTGKPVYARNSRGFAFRTEYDALRRPVRTYVAGPGITGEALQARTEYGESLPDSAGHEPAYPGRAALRRRRSRHARGLRLQGQPAGLDPAARCRVPTTSSTGRRTCRWSSESTRQPPATTR